MKVLSRWFVRTGTTLALLGIAVSLAVLAVAFWTVALYLALLERLGAPLAALWTGGALLAVAALFVLAARWLIRPPRRATTGPSQPNAEVAAARLGEMLAEEAGGWTKRHPGSAMFTALAAGFVVGSSPKLRSLLSQLFR